MSTDASGTKNPKGSLYENKTLLCKNKCGYYGNSIQYDGYCSICYRLLKHDKANQPNSFSVAASSLSFDDNSSLLQSSQSAFFDDARIKNGQQANSQIWNEHSSLNKFSSKKESRRSSAFKFFRRQGSMQVEPKQTSSLNSASGNSAAAQGSPQPAGSSALNLVETVSKAADRAVNLVDQSLQYGLLGTSNMMLTNENNIIEFNNCLSRLASSASVSTTGLSSQNASSSFLFGSNSSKAGLNTKSNKPLIDFEEQFRLYFPQLYQDLNKQVKLFADTFKRATSEQEYAAPASGTPPPNKQYEMVQDFFKKIYRYIVASASIKSYLNKLTAITESANLSVNSSGGNSLDSSLQIQQQMQTNDDAEKFYEAIMIYVESFVNDLIYDYVFPTIMSEFEEQDMNLQKRIRTFYWITNEMIGTCIDENSIFYRESYEEALNYIVEMDSKRTAHEKMLCITECSKNIYKAISISANISRDIDEASRSMPSPLSSPVSNENRDISSSKDGIILADIADDTYVNQPIPTKNAAKSLASADDYLPAFIYIVLKANPTMLYSNINFISRFAFEKRILQGEHAYHFCSLNAIIEHIENLNGQHLNMSQEQFDDYCNGLVDIDSSDNVLKLIQSNLKILSELKDKQKLLKQETFKLQTEMSAFKQTMQNNFNACLLSNNEKYTKNIPGFRKNVLDDNQDLIQNQTKLLQPLKPETIVTMNK